MINDISSGPVFSTVRITRHEEEPAIDYQLERDMVGLESDRRRTEKRKDKSPVIKANLNESSDFDLDNY